MQAGWSEIICWAPSLSYWIQVWKKSTSIWYDWLTGRCLFWNAFLYVAAVHNLVQPVIQCVLHLQNLQSRAVCVRRLDANTSMRIEHKNKNAISKLRLKCLLFCWSIPLSCLPTSHQHFSKVAWMIREKENQTQASNKRQKQYRYKLYSSRDWGRKVISAKKNNAGHKSTVFFFFSFILNILKSKFER